MIINVVLDYDPSIMKGRQSVPIISKYNFIPTRFAAENLICEGKNPNTIFITGNTAIDVMVHTVTGNYRNLEFRWGDNRKLTFITAYHRESRSLLCEILQRDQKV